MCKHLFSWCLVVIKMLWCFLFSASREPPRGENLQLQLKRVRQMQVPSKERESQRQQVSFPLYLSLGPYHTLESLCTEFVRPLPPSDFVPPPRPLDSHQNGCKCDHFLSVQVKLLCGCIGVSSCCQGWFFLPLWYMHSDTIHPSPPAAAGYHISQQTNTNTNTVKYTTQSHTMGSVVVIMWDSLSGFAVPDNLYVMMTLVLERQRLPSRSRFQPCLCILHQDRQAKLGFLKQLLFMHKMQWSTNMSFTNY